MTHRDAKHVLSNVTTHCYEAHTQGTHVSASTHARTHIDKFSSSRWRPKFRFKEPVKFTLCTCVSAVRTVFDLHLPSFPLKTGRAVALQKARPRRFSAPSCFRVCGLRVPLLPFFALVAEPPPGGSESFARRRTRFCISPLSRTLGRALLFPR